jgi:hypothetical protein
MLFKTWSGQVHPMEICKIYNRYAPKKRAKQDGRIMSLVQYGQDRTGQDRTGQHEDIRYDLIYSIPTTLNIHPPGPPRAHK